MNMKEEYISEKQIRRRTIWSFVVFFVLIGTAFIGWKWLRNSPKENNAPAPLRSALYTNETIFTAMFSNFRLSKTYPRDIVVPQARVNGVAGLSNNFDTLQWKLQLVKKPGDTLRLTIDDIKSLPKTEIVFDFKCIEGWNQVTHWGGVRFSDFVKRYHLEEQVGLQFTGLSTPDDAYYVGIDNKSMMHPQTMLCYEVNGKPLPMKQGAPLRLIIPVKYGVKHLKRIGTIYFSNNRPPDYWYERGYDYYCGL